MPKQNQKTSTSGNSHSYIFSDISRAIHREETLARKLKHLQDENTELENKIKHQEEEIKDERTVIIYQMSELVKTVANKLNVFQDFQLRRDMFVNHGQEVHDGLKLLMAKYEQIEKQQAMITKVRVNLSKMYQAYNDHKQSIEKTMKESTEAHQQAEQKIRQLIHQKRQEVQGARNENMSMTQQIERMKQQLQQFSKEQPLLERTQQQFIKQIEQKQKEIERQAQKYEEISKWAEIVVDRKMRHELTKAIKDKGKELRECSQRKSRIQMAVREQNLRVGAK